MARSLLPRFALICAIRTVSCRSLPTLPTNLPMSNVRRVYRNATTSSRKNGSVGLRVSRVRLRFLFGLPEPPLGVKLTRTFVGGSSGRRITVDSLSVLSTTHWGQRCEGVRSKGGHAVDWRSIYSADGQHYSRSRRDPSSAAHLGWYTEHVSLVSALLYISRPY